MSLASALLVAAVTVVVLAVVALIAHHGHRTHPEHTVTGHVVVTTALILGGMVLATAEAAVAIPSICSVNGC